MPKQSKPSAKRKDPAQRIAVIDVGSDTVHLVIVDATGAGESVKLKRVANRSELVQLGREVAARRRIGQGKIETVSRLTNDYARRARASGATLVLAATEAIREAANGSDILDRLSREIAEPIRLLSGEIEAELSFLGAKPWIETEGMQLFIDSGGSSTEVVISDGRTIRAKISIPVGAASLMQSIRGDPPRPLAFGLAGVQIGELMAQLPEGQPTRAVATGGSAHNLAQLDQRNPKQKRMTRSELDQRTKELMTQPAARLARRSGEDPRRVKLLAPGALILSAILKHYDLPSVAIAPGGLREGIALASLQSPNTWWQG